MAHLHYLAMASDARGFKCYDCGCTAAAEHLICVHPDCYYMTCGCRPEGHIRITLPAMPSEIEEG